jgi:hypothetical protein
MADTAGRLKHAMHLSNVTAMSRTIVRKQTKENG